MTCHLMDFWINYWIKFIKFCIVSPIIVTSDKKIQKDKKYAKCIVLLCWMCEAPHRSCIDVNMQEWDSNPQPSVLETYVLPIDLSRLALRLPQLWFPACHVHAVDVVIGPDNYTS